MVLILIAFAVGAAIYVFEKPALSIKGSSDASEMDSLDSITKTTAVAEKTITTAAASKNLCGEFAQDVIELTNQVRAAQGLKALTENVKLSKAAVFKSQDMADLGYLADESPLYGTTQELISQFGVSYTVAGVNIDRGQISPENAMITWMNSEEYRENIFSEQYTQVGVGVEVNADGEYLWTQIFIG